MQPAVQQTQAATAARTAATAATPAEPQLRRHVHAGKITLANALTYAIADAKKDGATKEQQQQLYSLQEQVIAAFKSAISPFVTGA
jgi:hypothetical protein